MNNKIINIILNIIIIILITIILFVIIFNVSKENKIDTQKDDQFVIVNSYEELNVAYNIIKKYLSCYANQDYDRISTYSANKVNKEIFVKNCECFSKEDWLLADIYVKEQKKSYDGEYIIKYTVNEKLNLTMTYVANHENYSFYILDDTLIGEIYE